MIKEGLSSDPPNSLGRTALRQARIPFLQEPTAKNPAQTANSTESLQAQHKRPRRRSQAAVLRQVRRVLVGDRGSVSAELVIAIPLVLFMLLAIVQFALWSHATHIAQAAAAQGLAACRAQDGTAADGQASAQQLLDELGRGPLTGTNVLASRTADSASIQITGMASMVIPLLHLPVHAEAAGPVERFVPDLAGGR